MMKKTGIVLLIMLMVVGSFAFAQGQKEAVGTEKDSYVFAGNAEWPPLEFVDEKGDVVGFEVDMLKEIEKISGKKITYRNVAWDGIFAGLANGAYDAVASGVSVTEERKATMDFSTPFMTITQAIIAPVDHPELKDLKSLAGKTVGTQMGTTGDLYLKDQDAADPTLNIDVKGYDSIGLAVEDLLNGNLDAVVCDSIIASDYVLSNPNYKGKMIVTGKASDIGEPIAIAIKKGDSALLKIVNDAIAQMQKDGTLDTLSKKWNIL
jgi:polar amino acid transport system substrate-binding protein